MKVTVDTCHTYNLHQVSENKELHCKHDTTFTRKILLLKAEFGENLILESYYRRIKFLNQIFNYRKVKFEGANACDLRYYRPNYSEIRHTSGKGCLYARFFRLDVRTSTCLSLCKTVVMILL